MKTLALTTLFTFFALCGVSAQQAKKPAPKPAQQEEQVEFMKVASTYTVTEDGKRCFQVRKGMSRKDANSAAWTPYCGKLNNFKFEQGYEYTLKVVKYDPNAEEMDVIKIVGRDNSGAVRSQAQGQK